ncbi:serine/arginine repetitive matrix protein 1-like [Dermacentor albipictus]|uniref:serine/arginine repetitive matrix protein 1-like n=1 Tax=Dermacentor albipictus TaxID=60249 RepID=UPI0031FDB5BD
MSEASPRREPAVGSSSSLTSSPASNGASRRTPVIRLHGAPTLSPRPAPKKGGRRASEFCFREPPEYVHLAPPRSTVSTPPPGRKRSASLPHVRSPSPVPPPLARAARAHHAAQQQARQQPGGDEEDDEDEEERRLDDDDQEEEDEDEAAAAADGRDTPPPPMAVCPEEEPGAETRQQHRSRLLGAATADRRKSTPCQPKFMQCRRGRPSLDLTAAQASGHITLGSHLESEIARRRHSVAATAAGADKPAATSSDRGLTHRTQAATKNRVAAASAGADALADEAARASWLREADSSDDDDDDDFDLGPRTVTPNSSPVMTTASSLAGARRPVS